MSILLSLILSISSLDKFKSMSKCLDIYHEYEYPIAIEQEKNRSTPVSVSNSCNVSYSVEDQYITWIDKFYKEFKKLGGKGSR